MGCDYVCMAPMGYTYNQKDTTLLLGHIHTLLGHKIGLMPDIITISRNSPIKE